MQPRFARFATATSRFATTTLIATLPFAAITGAQEAKPTLDKRPAPVSTISVQARLVVVPAIV